MTPPLRPALFTITERANIVTLRDAVTWYKHVYSGSAILGTLTAMETKYVNGEWAQLCKELAEKQGVPAGMLSYWLNELAVNEIELFKVAASELNASVAYPALLPRPFDGA